MSFQCPKCELRYTWQTELDDHCRNDHPDFHHDYPVGGLHIEHPDNAIQQAVLDAHHRSGAQLAAEIDPADSSAILKTWWTER
jgi:hypothetical protein